MDSEENLGFDVPGIVEETFQQPEAVVQAAPVQSTPVAETEEVAPPVVNQERSEDNFPTDFGEASRLLTQIDNEPNRHHGTRAEQRAKANRVSRLRRHVHAIQQGPLGALSSPAEMYEREQARRSAPDIRRARLEELEKKHRV